MSYSREQLDDIKKQAGIKPYEKRLKGFSQIGAECRGYCPWHEKDGVHNPSLAVYKDKKIEGAWSFGCMTKCSKKNGDVFAFVMLKDEVPFAEAVKRVAENAGVTAEAAEPRGIQPATVEQVEQARQYLMDNGVPLEFARKYTSWKAFTADQKVKYPWSLRAVVHPKLGLAIGYPYDCDPDGNAIKYRAVKPKDKNSKFAHASGYGTDTFLYNIKHAEKEIENDSWMGAEVFVVASERDCLMMEAQGFTCVSVSSESSCIDSSGNLKITDEQLTILAKAEYVFVLTDMDPQGDKCAEAFERCEVFSQNQVKRINWPWRGKRFSDPKDVGDLYLRDPAGFRNRTIDLAGEARRRPPRWRQAFKTPAEMDDREIFQLIEGFMPEGNIGLGGLSGHGKSFVALSIAKALTTGRPFVGHFKVPEIYPVLYLCPEVGERQLRKRIELFGIPLDDENLFLCRTLTQGPTLPLDHPYVIDAVRNMGNPVVVLDTAIRFSKAKDENSAAENQWMEQSVRQLREAGSPAVVLLCHSPKAAAKETYPTLEMTFRGTGDIGALLDIGYCIRNPRKCHDGETGGGDIELYGERISITNVKPRDFDPPPPFELGLRPPGRDPQTGKLRSYIKETGDLALMQPEAPVPVKTLEQQFEEQVAVQPNATIDEIGEAIGVSKTKVYKLMNSLGWEKPRDGAWKKVEQVVQ